MIRTAVALLFVLGPWYRYLRPLLMDWEAFRYTPFVLEALVGLLVAAALLRRLRRADLTPLDRAMVAYTAALLVSVAGVAGRGDLAAAVSVVKVYLLSVPVYFAARFFIKERTPALLRWYVVLVALSVAGIAYEHVLYNIQQHHPLDVLMTKYYASQEDYDPREYSSWINPESYSLPLFGNVIRPFGPLGAGPISGVLYASAFAWVLYAEHGRLRHALLLLTGLATFLTVSRSAYLSVLVVMIVYFWRRTRLAPLAATRVLTAGLGVAVLAGGAALAYPALQALLTRERIEGPAGLLATGVILKDLYVFGGDTWGRLTSGDLWGVAFGVSRPVGETAFDEVGRLLVEYWLTHVTDVAMLGWLSEVGVVPVALLAWALWISLRHVQRRGRRRRLSGVEAAWPMQVVIICLVNWHYSSLFKYSLDVFYMACLGFISLRMSAPAPEPVQPGTGAPRRALVA
jgi:hypothetical protein